MKHTIILSLFLLAITSISRSQDLAVSANDTTPFYRMSLEELMNVNVTVASHLPMTNRESPGIITIITQDEIQKSGAMDLMELLKNVPGFNFSVDVEGVVGIGVRGNWANEGKVLLLYDGIELNEDLYSTLQFGGHYSLDQVKRIEIIRGPGSAMYGGNAEYAVINIITENNSDFNGIAASVNNSMMSQTFGSRGISFAAGKSFGKAHLNFSTSFNQANRSQETYTDFAGSSYDMTEQSGIKDAKYRLDFFLNGLSIMGLYNSYSVGQRDGYDEIYLRSYNSEFNAGYITAKYELKKWNNLVVTPGIKFKFQQPWSYTKEVTDDEFKPFNTQVDKKEYFISTRYDPNEKINIAGGVNYYHTTATQKLDSALFNNGKKDFNIDNYAIYLQSIIKLSVFNVIAGCRYEFNPIYGSSFVPRMGITKIWDKFHFKTLYSGSFRTPSVENINANPEILPERTGVGEFEAGLRIGSCSYLTANVYDITTFDPIVYYYDESEEDNYKNESSTGTRGIEIEYKWKSRGWYATVNYSYYTTTGHTSASIYEVPNQSGKTLSFPSNKINATANVQLSRLININPSASFISTRYSYLEDSNGEISFKSYRPAFYANIALNFDDILTEKFSIQAACNNLFNEKILYIQPYNGNHQPLPGTGREYQLRLTYSFSFSGNK